MAHPLIEKAEVAVEILVEDAMGNERNEVAFAEVEQIALEVGISLSTIVALVKGYGLKIGERPIVREVRGFKSNPHDRWYGKGSSPTHGGSGWEQITGFAGPKG